MLNQAITIMLNKLSQNKKIYFSNLTSSFIKKLTCNRCNVSWRFIKYFLEWVNVKQILYKDKILDTQNPTHLYMYVYLNVYVYCRAKGC